MNATCPECNTELDEDFGIVTCTSCGAVCSVDLDGSVVVQSDDVDTVAGVIEVEATAGDTKEATFDTDNKGSFEDLESLAEESLSSEESTLDQVPNFSLEDIDSEASALEEPGLKNTEDVINESLEAGTSSSSSAVLSSKAFFQGLDIFSDQLESVDHFHTFFDLFVSGFETKKDLKEALELTLDERLEVTADKILFDTNRQEFRVAKVSYLRLVNLHKRLSTLGFVKLDWLLSESPKALNLSEKFISPLTAEESLSENLDFSEKSEEDVEVAEDPTQDVDRTEDSGFVEEDKDTSMVYDSDLTATAETEYSPPHFDDEDLNTLDSEDDFN